MWRVTMNEQLINNVLYIHFLRKKFPWVAKRKTYFYRWSHLICFSSMLPNVFIAKPEA